MPAISVEVFDPDPAVVARVTRDHAAALEALRHDVSRERQKAVVDEIRADGHYAYVEASLINYYDPPTSNLTIDVVEQRDAARRMPFTVAPTGSHPDPDGLLAAQQAYEDKYFELMEGGAKVHEVKPCPAFHCMGDPNYPGLRALAAPLPRGAQHLDELIAILHDDRDTGHRASAAYLIAYAPDGKRVVDAMLSALHDPSGLVRNNVTRVLAITARDHAEVDIPIGPILEMLTYPATIDRNKAAATLKYLLDRPGASQHFARVAREAGPTLLAMLKLVQPNNHDFAYDILKTISGEHYGDRDIAAWQAWLSRQPS